MTALREKYFSLKNLALFITYIRVTFNIKCNCLLIYMFNKIPRNKNMFCNVIYGDMM